MQVIRHLNFNAKLMKKEPPWRKLAKYTEVIDGCKNSHLFLQKPHVGPETNNGFIFLV